MIRPDTERIAIMAAMNGRRNATWPHLWPEVVGIVKGGDSLHGKELTALHDYLVASGRFDLTASDVQVVQFSRDWAASVLGGHDQRASRAIRQLQEIGLLVPGWFIAFFYTGLGIALALAGVGFLVHYFHRDGYITCPVTGKVREG